MSAKPNPKPNQKQKRTIFSHTILDKINREAKSSFPMDLLSQDDGAQTTTKGENWPLWEKHWFQVAENVHREFEAEGLKNTAEEVRKLINEQKRFANV